MIKVNKSPHGLGVFAARLITKGEEILQFEGDLLTFDESLLSGNQGTNALQIGATQYMDIQEPGVLVNHSCQPNCGIKDDLHLIAIKNINLGDELFYDYSTTVEEDEWSMLCTCNSNRCRGLISDFKYLRKPLRKQYLEHEIVQGFISIWYDSHGNRITPQIEIGSFIPTHRSPKADKQQKPQL